MRSVASATTGTRDALAALREGDLDTWAAAYRDRGRIVARPNARQARNELVRDWWQAARRDGTQNALMLAHHRADVRDLNDRARSLMHADGRLGDVELEVAERRFAVGDRVLATHNDRRLKVTNGQRGTIEQLHDEQHALSVRLDNGCCILLDAGYLEQGHLEHGYAATAHKAQGATVDSVFVLGSEDLYREWGYTALTRHRHEARFYVVSPSPAERALPGLEPQPDPLAERLERTLGDSRAKRFAMDLTEPAAVEREAELQGVVAQHDIEDACSYAWCQLVRRVDIALDDRTAGWLYRVAVHEGWRLAAIERGTLSYSPSLDDPEDIEAAVAGPAAPHTVEQLIATRLRLEEVRCLPGRQRRAILLFAFGLTYAEIAEHTGDSVRSVDRLLRRATQRLSTVNVDELPPREHAALASIASGLTIDETASKLGLSSATTRDYLASSRRRLGARTTAEAVAACGAR